MTTSRRRALQILAAGAALPLLPGRLAAPLLEWRGQALGAPARLLLAHPDPVRARSAAALCLDEIERQERIFSLFRPDSELSRLNRDGRLERASQDLRRVLGEAARVSELSGGAFDVTVQPLWQATAAHFRGHPGAADGPDRRTVEAALARVGWSDLSVDGAAVGFRRPGMAATLNGIAQGYITDRLAALLRDLGFERVLIEAGEIFALAPPDGIAPWPVGLPDGKRLRLSNRAVATSSGRATRFEPSGRHNHLFDPLTGESANRYASLTALADSALLADALSTALSALPLERIASLLAALPGTQAVVVHGDGRQTALGA